jgi:glycosyltransferase involved in cell wall biosynthesis
MNVSSLARPRVAIITNIIPHYRADFYRRLFSSTEFDCHVFCQDAIPGTNIDTAGHMFPGQVTLVKAVSASNERVSWQTLPYAKIRANFDVCFIYGNPRVVSGVLLSCVLRVLRIPVVIWGQAHTAGASWISEGIRLAWWRAFANLFVYNDAEVSYLRERGFTRQLIVGMNNGLDQSQLGAAAAKWTHARLARWRSAEGLERKIMLLSCARLVRKNRFDLVIDALSRLLEAEPALTWCVLGDGPERQPLEDRAKQRGVAHAIRWMGPLYDEEALAPWFMSSQVLVHPGAIGLTMLHAFGYGLPVITHDDRSQQMPEIAALRGGTNGVLFRQGDVNSLVETLVGILKAPGVRSRLSEAALRTAREEFNTEVMAERFTDMVHAVWKRNRGTANA